MSGTIVYDIETDGLLDTVSKVHCISTYDIDTGEKRRFTCNDLVNSVWHGVHYLEQANTLICHNQKSYDVLVLQKLHGFDPKGLLVDTLLLGCLMLPEKGIMSLENWAEFLRLTQKKVQHEDWSTYTEAMGIRCDADVDINVAVYKYLISLPRAPEVVLDALQLEQEVASIHAEQALTGVAFDVNKAIALVRELDERLNKRRAILMAEGPSEIRLPGIPIIRQESERAERLADLDKGLLPAGTIGPFKKDGNYTKVTEAYFGKDLHTVKGFYSKVEHKPFNPDSKDEVKKLLLSLGWKPTEWNFKKDKSGGLLKNASGSLIPTSPKLTEDSYGSLPPGLGQAVAEYNMMNHRRNSILNIKDNSKGALARVADRGDGRVSAEAFTCGTPTSRYRHQGVVCNIPRPSSPYGKEIRSLFTVSAGNLLVGVDLSGIEARCLAWYLLLGKFTDAQKTADLILSPDKGNDFHSYNAKQWGVSRDTAKSGLYALIYGAGAPKLANTLGKPESQGAKLKRDFYAAHPGIKELMEKLELALSRNGGYIKAVDGRPIFIRSNNRLLNSLLQTTAAIVFKRWMVRIHEVVSQDALLKDIVKQVIAYHDELQFEVSGPAVRVAAVHLCSIVEQAAIDVGKELGCPIPIEAEAKVGVNWAETH